MNRRGFLGGLAGWILVSGPAQAQTAQDQILKQLRDQGYGNIRSNRTLLGRVRILADRRDGSREIVFNPSTGSIMRDYVDRSDIESEALGGTVRSDSDDRKDDSRDDKNDSGSDDGKSGSGNSGSGNSGSGNSGSGNSGSGNSGSGNSGSGNSGSGGGDDGGGGSGNSGSGGGDDGGGGHGGGHGGSGGGGGGGGDGGGGGGSDD
jgi:hypothetical protein